MNAASPTSFVRTAALGSLVAAMGYLVPTSLRAQVGYTPQMPSAYQQRTSTPPRNSQPTGYIPQGAPNVPAPGAGLGGGQSYGYPQQQQSLMPTYQQQAYQQQYQQPAYQQLPPATKPRTKPKPVAPPTYTHPAQQGGPQPYPQTITQPKPIAPPRPIITKDQLAADVAALKANDRTQDRRLTNLEQQGGGTRSTSVAQTSTSTGYVRHQVRAGESLWGIADRYNASADDIRTTNRLTSNFVKTGDVLLIPVRSGGSSSTVASSSKRTSTGGTHIVQRGESLGAIAASYRVSTASLQSANGIKNANLIAVGQKLVIPGKGTTASAPVAAKGTSKKKGTADGRYIVAQNKPTGTVVTAPDASPSPGAGLGKVTAPTGPRGVTSYRVEPGDTVETVAHNYSTTPSDLARINQLKGNKLPAPGEEIVVPLPGAVSM